MDSELSLIMNSAGDCTKAAWHTDQNWQNAKKYKRIFNAMQIDICDRPPSGVTGLAAE